jgi:trehalose 6-phosphate synthase/phosphatase
MRERIRNYDVNRWARDFMQGLEEASEIRKSSLAKSLRGSAKRALLSEYVRSSRRLILLDYDGTLKSFVRKPDEARPDKEVLSILEKLSKSDGTEVVIVSGRDSETLDRWFGELDIGLVAEHGVWTKRSGGQWRMVEHMENDWKDLIRPVLQSYVIKTPGTLIEEKGYSLAWHYRNADPNQAKAQLSEMKETLHNLTSNLNVGILDGNKVIEIKNRGINKGRAVERWLEERRDFILAIGDDWTDEDMFETIGDKGFTVRVGFTNSSARYHLKNVNSVRRILIDMIRKDS